MSGQFSFTEFSFGIGDIVIYNEKGGNYRLFQIHDRRYGSYSNEGTNNQYAGYLLDIKKTRKFDGMLVPVFETILTNVSEKELRVLKDTKIQFDIWNKMEDRLFKKEEKAKHKIGEMVIIKRDEFTSYRLYHIHDITRQQGLWLYGGYDLEIKKNEEFGIMVPVFCTTCIFVQEKDMIELKDLRLTFKPWNK